MTTNTQYISIYICFKETDDLRTFISILIRVQPGVHKYNEKTWISLFQ